MRIILFTRTGMHQTSGKGGKETRKSSKPRPVELSICEVVMCSAAHVDASTGPGGVCRRQPLRLKRMEVTRRLLK